MWPTLQDWLSVVYIMVPAYCTNGAPVVFGGGPPIDFGKSLWDGNRVFGDHKTIRGFASGILVGAIIGTVEYNFLDKGLLTISVLASLGSLLGDLLGAFVKRRLRLKPGVSLPIFDQLDFVVGALLLVSFVSSVSLGTIMILLLVTPPIHILTNLGAYALGLKGTRW